MSQVKSIAIIILIIANNLVHKTFSVPLSPCPQNFHYEYDGFQWIGVINVPFSVYETIMPNKITTVIVLVVNGQLPNNQNFGALDLYQPLTETYKSIANKQNIKYRITFPTRSLTPTLLEININNFRICTNRIYQPNIYTIFTRIQLQHSFQLMTLVESIPLAPVFDGPIIMDQERILQEPKVVSPLKPTMNVVTDQTEEIYEFEKSPVKPTEVECGRIDDQFRLTHLISGGKRLPRGTWPWIVAIYVKEANGITFKCTGNVLSNRIVLTAAHCIRLYSRENQYAPKELLLAFGRYNLMNWSERDATLSDVEEIIVHPDYLKEGILNSYDADIALLVTKKFVDYGSMIKPVCLWPAESSNIENGRDIIGLTGTLVGWSQPSESSIENYLRKLNMQVVPKNVCFPSTKSRNRADPKRRVFCARATPGNGPCSGDSGSGFALAQNGAWYLRGIVSAAIGDPILNRCELNTYIIFSDIIKFRPWIDMILSKKS